MCRGGGGERMGGVKGTLCGGCERRGGLMGTVGGGGGYRRGWEGRCKRNWGTNGGEV